MDDRPATQSAVLSLGPLAEAGRQWSRVLAGYRPKTLRRDALAGLSVAVLELPQAVAYAVVAQVPPQYGIYTSIVHGVLAALFSSNEHLASGPTNTQSLLVAAAVSQIVDPGNAELYLQLVIGIGLIKGLIQLLFAAARMGNLVRYVSSSVMVGFAAGAGVLIAVGQVPSFLGIEVGEARRLPGVVGEVEAWLPHLRDVNPLAVALGCGTLLIVLAMRWASPLLPGPLVGVVLPAAAVWLAGWTAAEVPLLGPLPEGVPWPAWPEMSLAHAEALLGGAFALALLGMIETVSIGKVLTSRAGEGRINANQEFFAQGIANAVGSFFHAIPGSASFTRSALNQMAGGQTRLAAVFGAGFVLAIFLLFADAARYVALPSLAAILFVIAYTLIDWRAIRRIVASSREDAVVCGITFAAALLLPLAYAIYVGIFLNIALYLRQASRLHLAEMVHTPAGPFLERPIRDKTGDQQVMFLQLEGDLFFGVADELQDRLTALAHSGLRVVILRLKRTHSIDATVLGVLERFIQQMHQRQAHVLLCGVKPDLMERLESYGLLAKLGKPNVFPAAYGVFTSAKQALQRAKQLLSSSLDADHIREMDEREGWAFEI